MIKKRTIIVFALMPFIMGYLFASTHTQKHTDQTLINFNTSGILPNDEIVINDLGNIIVLTKNQAKQITHGLQLSESTLLGTNYIAVNKQTNYSSLLEINQSGDILKTLLNGNTGNIDTMDWYTDPSVSPDHKMIAFVSDRDKQKTNVLDNALFIDDLQTNTIKRIVDPQAHTGGIAHPIWDPADPNILAYDNYQYDENDTPYSTIMTYDFQSGTTANLTSKEQNAYQGSFSPDGKQFLFLSRNGESTVNLNIANLTDGKLTNIQTLKTGDLAYPEFSSTLGNIYYLEARENNGYDLFVATITNNALISIKQISQNGQLLGNSGFTVSLFNNK